MNKIITDIKALQEETLLNLQSSKAKNTIRAYKLQDEDTQKLELTYKIPGEYPHRSVMAAF